MQNLNFISLKRQFWRHTVEAAALAPKLHLNFKPSDFHDHLPKHTNILSFSSRSFDGSYGASTGRGGRRSAVAYALAESSPTFRCTRSSSSRALSFTSEKLLCCRNKTSVSSGVILFYLLNLFRIEFADCALGRTFTAPFKCRQQNRAMNNCMVTHATQAEQDAAREEWFATRLKRQREREAKEARRIEQERFHKEWWGLPTEDREGDKGRDIMKKAERVGGFPKRDEGQLSKDRHR